MPKGNPLYGAHVSLNIDDETNKAIEAAAAAEERPKADWMRYVLRRELRQRGLLPVPKPDRQRRRVGA